MFIIKSFQIKNLDNQRNLIHDKKLKKLIQKDINKESYLETPVINPVWIDYFEGFEINPNEKGFVIALSQDDQYYEFISALEQWKKSNTINYYSPNYFRKIIQYWQGKLKCHVKFLVNGQRKSIGELKVGFWVIGNHIDYLSEFGITKHTSINVKSHRILPLKHPNKSKIPSDVPLNQINSVKYQDFKNQKPAKSGIFNKKDKEVEFYESIYSSFIRLLFDIQVKSEFIYDFEQISQIPSVSVLLKEGINYVTNGIIESIRIDEKYDRYTHYDYFYDQPFEIGVTCQSQRDLRDYTNQILQNLKSINPIYIPTHDFYLGFYLSQKPQYFQAIENLNSGSLYSSLFEITFKFVPEIQQTYLYNRISNIDLTIDNESEIPLQRDYTTDYLVGYKQQVPLVGVIPQNKLNHGVFQNYNSNVVNNVGYLGEVNNRHVEMYNSPEIINGIYRFLPRYSLINQIINDVGVTGKISHNHLQVYQNNIVTTIGSPAENYYGYITNRDLIKHKKIEVFNSNVTNGIFAEEITNI